MTDKTPMKGKGKTVGTLTDSDIVTERKIGRRSLLGLAGAAVLGAVAAIGARPGEAAGYTDSDTGNYSDGPGNGRGPARRNSTGLTDGDQGNNADRPNFGRGNPRTAGGGGGGGYTDSDQAPYADGPGRGRGPQRRQPTGSSDSDQGANADQPNYGRGPARP